MFSSNQDRCKAVSAAFFAVLVMIFINPLGAEEAPIPPIDAWQRYAENPILTPEFVPAPQGAFYPVMADPTLLFEGGKFKMWFGYGGLDKASDESTVRVRVGYAESDDGLQWKIEAPSLDPGGTWDRTNAETPSVVIDPKLPEGHPRRYRMYYSGLDHELEKQPFEKLVEAGMVYGIGLAFSPDGKRFTRLPAKESPYGLEGLVLKPDAPVLEGETKDFLNVADPHVLYHNGKYHMWYTSMCAVLSEQRSFFAIGYATSSDGIRWKKQGIVLRPDLDWETGRAEAHVGRPYVLRVHDRFEMYYDAVKEDGNPMKNTSAGVGLAVSTDGKAWQKHPSPIFMGMKAQGEKKGMIIGTAVLYKDGKYHLYYPGADPNWDRFTINLATHE